MITDDKKWHYLAVKKLPALFRGITSKHDGDFYCLNCFHSYTTENKFKKHKNVCENHDYCYNKTLKYKQDEKIMKFPFMKIMKFTIYADLESLLGKMST